jgi:hypothetical protein
MRRSAGPNLLISEQQERTSGKASEVGTPICEEQNAAMAIKTGTMQAGTTQAEATVTEPGSPQRIPHWLQQAERFLRVIVRIYLGLLVCLAPWYPPAWEANPLFQNAPSLVHWISYGAVRGIVSGLGLLNLWIALGDALRPLRYPPPGSGN